MPHGGSENCAERGPRVGDRSVIKNRPNLTKIIDVSGEESKNPETSTKVVQRTDRFLDRDDAMMTTEQVAGAGEDLPPLDQRKVCMSAGIGDTIVLKDTEVAVEKRGKSGVGAVVLGGIVVKGVETVKSVDVGATLLQSLILTTQLLGRDEKPIHTRTQEFLCVMDLLQARLSIERSFQTRRKGGKHVLRSRAMKNLIL